jgi:Tol biopolymer transport system component
MHAGACLESNAIEELASGTLDSARHQRAMEHLDSCATCRHRVAIATHRRAGPNDAPPFALSPGDQFARYVVVKVLGAGAMGVVYAAIDPELDRKVALKLVRGAVGAGATVPMQARVLREAKAAAALAHPNVVVIYEVGRFAGHPFIAMELVEGGTVRDWLAATSRSQADVLAMFLQVGEGLAAAHEAGIVHRDLKPDNILVGRDGRPRIADFGLARQVLEPTEEPPPAPTVQTARASGPPAAPDVLAAATDGADASSRSGSSERGAWSRGLLGTPAYMSPEQWRAEPVDARSDQYAFAVSLYEGLYGVQPRPGGIRDALASHAKERRVSSQVYRALLRATETDPAKRFPDVAALLRALTDATARRGHARLAALAAVLVASAVTIGAVAARAVHGSAHGSGATPPGAVSPTPAGFTLRPTDAQRITFADGCQEFPAFTPDGARLVYAAEGSRAEHLMVRTLADGAERALTRGVTFDFAAAISPDGSRVAFLRVDSDGKEVATYVVDLEGRTEPRRVAGGGTRPSFSPDGSAVWAGSKRHPARYDLVTGEATRTLDSPPNAEMPLVHELPDGRVLATYPGANWSSLAGVAVFSSAGQMTWLAQVEAEEVLALSPDGKFVLGARETSTYGRELFALPLDGGAMISVPSSAAPATKGLAFSPDGHRVAWSACTGVWSLGHLDAKGAFVELARRDWDESAAAAVPGTNRLAAISSRGGVPALWLLDRWGREAPRHVWSGDPGHAPREVDVSPDGSLAVVGTKAGLVVVHLDDGRDRPLTTNAEDASPRFRRDGREVVFTRMLPGGAPQVSVVDVEGGEAQPLLEPDTRQAAPSPVDDRLVYLAGHADPRLPMIVDLATHRARPLSPKLEKRIYLFPAFSPDGRRVALVVGDTRLVEVDVATGAVLRDVDAEGLIGAPLYLGDELWVPRMSSRGNVWMAALGASDDGSPGVAAPPVTAGEAAAGTALE